MEKKNLNLETKNYLLRHLSSKDLPPEYFNWLKNPDVTRHLFMAKESSDREHLLKHVDSFDGKDNFFFGLFDKAEKFIGTHGLRLEPHDRRCSMGVMIGEREYWGKNVVLEVRTAILNFAFYERDCEKAEAGCFRSNVPAIYNFQRLGWILEGVRRSHRSVGEIREDLLLFGLLRGEWDARRNSL